MTIKILNVLWFFLGISSASFSQLVETKSVFNKYTVAISQGNNNEDGSGLIIGKVGDNLKILTAKHVVINKTFVKIKLEGITGLFDGHVDTVSDFYDLALLSINAKSYKWEPYYYVNNLIPGDSVFIISANRDKIIIPADNSGRVNDIDQTNILSKIRGIIPGDSGTPLWTNDGLAGMIYTRSPVQALPITLIKKYLNDEWDFKWQLTETSIYRSPVDTTTAPDFNDVNLPFRITSIDGDCKDSLFNLMDNNVNTYWSCRVEGMEKITFHFKGIQSIRKIKFFDNGEDFPKGFIEIPNIHFKISLSKVLTSYLDKDENGKWYVFDLGKFYRTDQVELSFKVKRPFGEDKVTELKISEIKFTGLNL